MLSKNYISYTLLLFIGIGFPVVSSQEAKSFLYEDGDCQAVQAFQTGRNYYYKYDGTAIHTDSTTNQAKFGLRAKCSRVITSILSSCVGRLKVEECVMYDGETQDDGTFSFGTILPKSAKLNHMLHRYPVYFYFNSGEITKAFFHESEPSDIINMKKAILSALSLKFTGQGFKQSIDNTFKISSTSIFGVGDSYASVAMKTGTTMNITTRRYLFEHQLPWTQYENSVMRMSGVSENDNSDFLRFIAHEAHTLLYNKIGSSTPTQTCQYYVKRGRLVTDVTCNELHTVPFFMALVRSQNYQDANNYMSTSVTLHLEMYRISTLKTRERMTNDQKLLVQTSYKNHTLMFQSDLNEAEETQLSFDPRAAFLELLKGPKAKSSPVFAKLTLWIQNQEESAINALWHSIISSLASNPQEIPKAMNVWIQLLKECMDPKWCLANGDCNHLVGCQTAFSSLLSTSDLANMEQNVQLYLLDTLSSIKNPISALLQTALYLASANPSPATILALGKTLNRHAASGNSKRSGNIILEAKELLHDIISRKCSVASENLENEEMVKYAIKSLGPLLKDDDELLGSIITCMREPSVPSAVLTSAIQSMNEETVAALPKVRRHLVRFLSDRKFSHEPRLASFLVLMINNPNNQEISTVLTTINDPEEEVGIKYFMNEYIKSQLLLCGTEYGLFSNSTVERILRAMDEAGMSTDQYQKGSKTSKKTFEFRRALSLPIIEQMINGTMKMSLYFSGKNPAPFIIDFSFQTEIHDVNISLVDIRIDVGKVMTILTPLVGENGFLPLQVLDHLMNIPLYQWLEPSEIHVPHMPERNLNKWRSIADQFKLAQTLIDVQKKSFLDIKLFGKEISSNYLTKFSFFNELSFSKVLKLMDKLNEGISINTTLLSMPGFFKSKVPTSIGLPLTTNVEFTQRNNLAFSLMIEVKKLYFTHQGTCNIQVDHAYQMHTVIERVIKLPRGKPCGSGVLLTTGHDISVQVEATYSPKGLKSKTSTRPRNQLFQMSTESLAPSWTTPTGFEITSNLGRCRKSMINGYYDVSLYTTKCGGPIAPSETGLWLESNGIPLVKDYIWGRMQAFQDGWQGSPVPAVGFNLKVYRPTEATENTPAVVDFSIKYLPLQQEIQMFSLKANRPIFMMRSNFLVSHDESEVVDKIFASFNITTAFPILTSTVFFQKATPGTTLEQKVSSLNLLHVFRYGSGVGYDVKASVVLPASNMEFNMLGHVPTPTSNGEFTGVAKIFLGPSIAQSLCTVVYERSTTGDNNQTATKVDVTLKELRTQFFPYENTSLSMTWFNETGSEYRKILRLESWLTDEVSGPFIDFRQATVFSPGGDRSKYHWNATITSQKFQGQWTTDSKDQTKFTINSHLVIPDNPITVADVRPTAFHLMQIPVHGPGVKVYGIDVSLGTVPKGHINTTVFSTVNQYKSYIHLTRSRANCDHCFALEINGLAMQGLFKFEIRPNILQNSVSLRMLPSLARNLDVPTYFFSTYDNGQLKLGYNIDVIISNENVKLTAHSRAGSYVCNVLGGLMWEPEDLSRLHKSYASNITLSCDKEVANFDSISDLVLGADITYTTDNTGSDKTRKIDYNHFVQKSEQIEFNETYSVSMEVDEQLLKQFSLLRSTEYSLAESEDLDAVTGKKGSYSAVFTHQEASTRNSWSSPNYHLNSTGVLPSVLLTPGDSELRYFHTGLYFLGSQATNEEELEEICESITSCEDRHRNLLQANIDRSLSSLLRLLDYSFNEYQVFVDAPWNQLRRVISSPSYVEISPYHIDVSGIKDAGSMVVARLKQMIIDYDQNIQKVLQEQLVMEASLLNMQRYLKMLAMLDLEEEYDLTPAKIYIESLFRMIYQFDFALGSVLENPLTLPNYANLLSRKFSSFFLPQAWIKYFTKPYTIYGVMYPDVTQLITMNKHYHNLPVINHEDCEWLSLVDFKDGLGTAMFNHNALLAKKSFLGGFFIQSRRNIFSTLDASNNVVPVEFPAISSLFVCTKLITDELQCNSPLTNERYIYDPVNDEVISYVEMRGIFATSFEGLFGVADNETAVPKFMLPDGSVAHNGAKFMNSYELSGQNSCQYSPEDFTSSLPNTRSIELCEEAFAPFANPLLFNQYDVRSLVEACREKARSRQDTCKYTGLLIHGLRRNGLQVFTDPACLNCGAARPITVTINQVNILLIVSRSENMQELDPPPETLLPRLVRNTLQRLQQDGIANPTMTLLTYGGALHFFQPMINTIGGAVDSSNLGDIERVISNLEFNGPPYDSSLTAGALGFATETMRNSPQGIMKIAIVVAPETINQNIGGQIPPSLAQSFNEDLTSVFMISSLNDEECANHQITLPQQTTGGCHVTSEFPALGQAILRIAQEKVNRQVSCTCEEKDGYTALIASQCSFV